MDAPLTLLLKLIAPLPDFTVTLPPKVTPLFKLTSPPPVVMLAPKLIMPDPAGVTVIAPLPVVMSPLISMLELPALPIRDSVPAAVNDAPLAISMPAVASAPARPVKLEPRIVKLPLLLTEPPLMIYTPPVPPFNKSPVNPRFAPPLLVSAPVIVMKRFTANVVEVVKFNVPNDKSLP